jgi:hypothetical protein
VLVGIPVYYITQRKGYGRMPRSLCAFDSFSCCLHGRLSNMPEWLLAALPSNTAFITGIIARIRGRTGGWEAVATEEEVVEMVEQR